jgi:hypothetical protein
MNTVHLLANIVHLYNYLVIRDGKAGRSSEMLLAVSLSGGLLEAGAEP